MMSVWVISCAFASLESSLLETEAQFHHQRLSHAHHSHSHKYVAAYQPDPKLINLEEKMKEEMKNDEDVTSQIDSRNKALMKKMDDEDMKEFNRDNADETKFEHHMRDSEAAFESALRKSEKAERQKGEAFVSKFVSAMDKDPMDGVKQELDSSFLQTADKEGEQEGEQVDAKAHTAAAIEARNKAEQEVIAESTSRMASEAQAKLRAQVQQLHHQTLEHREKMQHESDERIKKMKEMERNMKAEENHLKEMEVKHNERDAQMMERYHRKAAEIQERSKKHFAAFQQKALDSENKWHEKREEEHERFKAIEQAEMNQMRDGFEGETDLRTE